MNVKRITQITCVLAFVVMCGVIVGCEKMTTMMPPPETPPAGITIGVAVALTGENAAPYGIPMQEGLELAREQLNMAGANITFATMDAMSTVEGGTAAVQALVDKGVPVIIGIGISTHLEEAFPIAQAAGVVAISPISSAAGLSAQVGDYAFRIGLATDVLTPTGITATKEKLGYEKVAMIYDSADSYSTSSYEELKKALEANEVEIVATETFATKDTDFTTQLTSIKDSAPDAVFVAALSTEMVEIIKQARSETIGISMDVDLVVPDLTNAEAAAAEGAAEGAVTFAGWSTLFATPGNPEFIQAYMAKYEGREPSPWAAQAYASLYILANALQNAESLDSAGIRDALAMTMDLTTILGAFSFDANGEAMYGQIEERVALIVEEGKLKILE